MGIKHNRSFVSARTLVRSIVVLTSVALSVAGLPFAPVSDAAQAAASLEQCRNGAATDPVNCDHVGGADGWVSGNAGASNAHYIEGHSIPYRAELENLPIGTSISLDLGYDIKHSGTHAIDYLTHYDNLEPHAAFGHPAETFNPIVGTSAPNTFDTHPIPAPSSTDPCASPVAGQPTTSFNALDAAKRLMTLYGGDITAISYVSEGCLTDTQAQTVIRVTFTPSSADALLAWGGHIAREQDWGDGNSASAISGSPYHMRVLDWDCTNEADCDELGNLGNQDRSLSTDAVVTPGKIIIVKDTVPNDDEDFTFTIPAEGQPGHIPGCTIGPLDDDGDPNNTLSNTDECDALPGTYTVSEDDPGAGYTTTVDCDDANSTQDAAGRNASIVLEEGETVTCTFVNTGDADLIVDKTPDNGSISVGTNAEFEIDVTNNGPGDAINVVLDDNLPDPSGDLDWTVVSVTKNGSGDFSSLCDPITNNTDGSDDVLHCEFGNMAAGDTFTITVSAETTEDICDVAIEGSVVLPNTAEAGADNHAVVDDDGQITVDCADLDVVKTPDSGSISVGTNADFTIEVTNDGPGVANNVVLDDNLPDPTGDLDWTVVSVTKNGSGDFSSLCDPITNNTDGSDDVLHCEFGDMDPGDTFTVTVRAATTEDICDVAIGGAVVLPNTAVADADNHVEVDDDGQITVNCPDIEVDKTPDGSSITVGTNAEFEIDVTNNGPGEATNVILDDNLPDPTGDLDWTIVSVTKNGLGDFSSLCDPITNNTDGSDDVLHCEFGDMAAGDTFTVTVGAATPEDVCDVAIGGEVVLPNTADADADNHAVVDDDGEITLICPGTVTVTKLVNGSDDHDVQFTFSLYTGTEPLDANLVGTLTTNSGGEGTTLDFGPLAPGTYTLCEDVPANYSSDLGAPPVTIGPAEACETFTLEAGEDEVFEVNNIPCPDLTPGSDAAAEPDPGGRITVTKEMPVGGGAATFTYTVTGPDGSSNVVDTGQIVFDAGQTGPKTLVLTTPGGVTGDFVVTQEGPDRFVPQDPIAVTIDPDSDCGALAAFEIAQAPPEVRVVKTETLSDGTKRKARGVWTFYLIGPDTDAQTPGVQGDTQTKRTNTDDPGVTRHRILWDGLEPGDYTLCEKFVGGWKSNLGGSSKFFLPNGDRCVNFSLDLNDSRKFRVNNRCPNRTPVPR